MPCYRGDPLLFGVRIEVRKKKVKTENYRGEKRKEREDSVRKRKGGRMCGRVARGGMVVSLYVLGERKEEKDKEKTQGRN